MSSDAITTLRRRRAQPAPIRGRARRRHPAGRVIVRNRRTQAAAVLLVVTGCWYTVWLLTHLNAGAPWLAYPFAAATCVLMASLLVSAVNNWQRAVPHSIGVRRGREPTVAVVLTTAREPAETVERTARSVLEQDWPQNRLRLIISDDADAPAIAAVAARLRSEHPRATVVYRRPPRRGARASRGGAGAGNLNAALAFVRRRWRDVAFIETRDADDEVVDRHFLRQCVAQLQVDPGAAFVQTIKAARVSQGDPRDNLQARFFRGAMLARYAANAVFPCGSGLVWRRAALRDIGGLPTWRPGEVLQSGIEALRRGWRGVYLPIVGARAQHAPGDIPNTDRQRGTWTLDTMRLLIWASRSGLTLRQRLQFWEPGLFYLQGVIGIPFIAAPIIASVAGISPVDAGLAAFALNFCGFGLALELFLASTCSRYPYGSLWRAHQITRKRDAVGWYWREALLRAVVLALLVGSMVYGLAAQRLTSFEVGSAYWAAFFATLLGGFLCKSWSGVDVAAALRRRLVARRLLAAAAVVSGTVADVVFLAVVLQSGGRFQHAAVLPAVLGVLVLGAASLLRLRYRQAPIGTAAAFLSAGLLTMAALVA
jgi:cellulose synthase (UDP-forming)